MCKISKIINLIIIINIITENDLDRYKRVYSVSEQLVNFIESLEEHQLFDAKSSRQQKDGIIYMLKF